VAIVGDILHSRVARSNIFAMQKLGMEVRVCGPPTLLPRHIEGLGVQKFIAIERAIADVDVIMMLRIQRERMGAGLFPTLREYSKLFGLNLDRLKMARPDVLIMHPGPINRGVEIAPEVADGPFSLILDQVENGLAIRMALLYLLAGGPAGLPEGTAQKPQARVQMSPRIMKVAVPCSQHSPMLGQRADSQTV
jgi:aspartate carbamoyltransferase catalytic subunit